MDLPLTNEELDYIVTQLWKGRKSEAKCEELYERLVLVQRVMKESAAHKKVLREEHGMVI